MLFALFGSGLSLTTLALFTRIVPAATPGFTFTVTATVAAGPPLAIDPRLHLSGFDGSPGTTPAWHEPWLGTALTKLTSAGSTSVTATFGAEDGPRFATLIL